MLVVGDLIIIEIFLDFMLLLGLLFVEFVEIYNNSNKVLDFGGLVLSIGSLFCEINDVLLLFDSYIIFCDEDDVVDFEVFGEVVSLVFFLVLINGGDDLILFIEDGVELVVLVYDIFWYQDFLCVEGGYMMELIELDLFNDCFGNW